MRVFLDANVMFSAAWRDDAAAALLWSLAESGYCQLLSSRLAVEEARRNLASKRAQRGEVLENLLGNGAIGAEPGAEHLAAARAQGLPFKDIPILAAAIAQKADLLVTGDRRDFGHLYGQAICGLIVLPLPDTVERLLEGTSGTGCDSFRRRPR